VNDCPRSLWTRLVSLLSPVPLWWCRRCWIFSGDKTMEKFGWPMGPCLLIRRFCATIPQFHADQVMAKEGFPDRMKQWRQKLLFDRLFRAERFGQKNGKVFIVYEPDRRGKRKKCSMKKSMLCCPCCYFISPELTEEDIIARMMIPLCVGDCSMRRRKHCASAAEAEHGIEYMVIGFLHTLACKLQLAIDQMGLQAFCDLADKYSHLR